MATYLYRLGKTAYRRWPFFLAAWVVLIAAMVGFAIGFSKPTSDAFTIPGIPSEEAADIQAELFPDSKNAFDQATVFVVVAAPKGDRIDDPRYSGAIETLVDDITELPQVPAALASKEGKAGLNPINALKAGVPDGAAANFYPVTKDGRIGVITFDFDVETVTDVKPATQDDLEEVMAKAAKSGLEVEANGQGMANTEQPSGTAELIGIALALLVLILTFGSLAAAGLPILGALVGLAIGILGILGSSAFFNIDSSTPTLAGMIGLAVGIDYSLFILARYRAELEHTEDREEAVGIAVGTAGSAVVFAGLTVLIALSALAVVRIPFLTTMGLAASATVFVAVLVALTFLPAMLGLLKSKAFGGRVRRYTPRRETDGKILNNGVRWARLVGRHPVAAVLLVVVALGALALPIKDLYLAFPSDATAPSSTTQRQASDLIRDGFGPGREAPLSVVVDARELAQADRPAAYQQVVAWAEKQPGVLAATDVAALQPTPADPTAGGTNVIVIPEYGPDDPRTKDLLLELRKHESSLEKSTGTDIGITGLTAITTDVSDRLNGALAPYLAVVIGLAFLLLIVVFRSILVPLTATIGFLFSVLATLGATVLFFQKGTFGFMEGQPVVSFIPIFIIGVVFGLAMDYQVFLVTRMREAHVHGASPYEAVVDGFRGSARVVTAAAVIMTAVFAGFMLEDDAVIKSFGFALATAVVLDAFVVRMVLIPALMYLMGEKAWWIPAWLDRILPDVDVEGEKLERPAHKPEHLETNEYLERTGHH
ncbi:RND superfamily putative drug exporter [Marmoricola sp. OAE513]|uniref:MMPL family transporter n=1 Tax=Marmoricola sp. OAE513 TaxID=2817894 RepID=UPI001AE7553B